MNPDADDQQVRSLLRPVGRPSAPPPQLEARIRAELVGSNTAASPDGDPPVVVGGEHVPDRGRKAPRLLVAAALLLVAAIGIVVVLAATGTDGRVGTDLSDQRPNGRVAESEVRPACDQFADVAFSPYGRQAVIGPQNAEHLTTTELTKQAATNLRGAIVAAVDALELAGVDEPALEDAVRRALASLDLSIAMSDQARLTSAQGALVKVRDYLLAAEQVLTRLGVPSCL